MNNTVVDWIEIEQLDGTMRQYGQISVPDGDDYWVMHGLSVMPIEIPLDHFDTMEYFIEHANRYAIEDRNYNNVIRSPRDEARRLARANKPRLLSKNFIGRCTDRFFVWLMVCNIINVVSGLLSLVIKDPNIFASLLVVTTTASCTLLLLTLTLISLWSYDKIATRRRKL